MRDLRLTIQDLMSAARQQGVFDISQIQYAIIETNGSVSILQKSDYVPITNKIAGIKVHEEILQHLIICDGKIIKKSLTEADLDNNILDKHLKEINLKVEEIMMLTYGGGNFSEAIRKEK